MTNFLKEVSALARFTGFWPALVDVIMLIAFATALTGTSPRLAIAIGALGLLVIGRRSRRELIRTRLGVGALSHYLVGRFALLATLGVIEAREGGNDSPVLVLLAILAVYIAGERVLRRINGNAVPYAEHFPGFSTRSKPLFRYGLIYTLNYLVLVVLLLQALLPVSLVPIIIVALAIVGIMFVAAGIDVFHRIKSRREFENSIGDRLEELAPAFYLHWQAPAGTAYQVAMWLPYLERIGVPYAIIVRTVANFREIVKLTDRPVLLRRTLGDLDPIIVETLRGVFYVNTATRNAHMIRYTQLKHIQLNHGDSDKVPSFNPVFRMYDLDFVAGQAAIDRFSLNGVYMPESMFRIVGRPQVDQVEPARRPISAEKNPTVLYAPTWAGFYDDSNYSSLLAGEAIVRNLLARGCTVVFRPHPYTRRNPELRAARARIEEVLTSDSDRSGRDHVFGERATHTLSIFDCFNLSDAMIADVSSVVGDYLHSGKPFAMVATRDNAESFELKFPMARASYVLCVDGPRLLNDEEVLQQLLLNDVKAARRQELAKYYLGDIPRETYSEHFVKVAQEELEICASQATDV